MRTLTATLFAATFMSLSLQAGTHPPAAVQSGPYSWTTGPYQYDGSGNITSMGTHTFIYDPLNRLSASYMTTPDTVSNKTYTYDQFGNLTQQTTADVVTPLPTGLTTNHLDATIAGYDDAGDVTQLHPPGSADTYGFTYDALGSISSETMDGVTVSYFVYTADDERLRLERVPSGPKHWRVRGSNQTVLRDFQRSGSTWNVLRDYIYRGPLLAAITPTTVEHFSLDHLGSPRLLTDAVGNKIALHTYLPFGKELGATTNDGEPMKFTGHERDDDPAGGTIPLDYMHARYYTPDIARFLSVDVHPGNPHAPQSWNRYIYARGNPTKFMDPDGNDIQLAGANSAAVFNFLVHTARHAQGRADLAAVANNHRFVATYHDQQINTPQQIQNIQTMAARGLRPTVTLANTTPDHTSGATTADVAIDTNAVVALHRDPSGVTTIEHETGAHVIDLMNNVAYAQIVATDTSGTAEAYGRGVANSPMDMTEQEATAFVMSLFEPLVLPPTLTDLSDDFGPPEE